MTFAEIQQAIEAMLQVQRDLQERQLQFLESQIRQSDGAYKLRLAKTETAPHEIETLKETSLIQQQNIDRLNVNSDRQQRNIERLIQLVAGQQVDLMRTEDLLDRLEQRVRRIEDN
jgi:hypothetical protein